MRARKGSLPFLNKVSRCDTCFSYLCISLGLDPAPRPSASNLLDWHWPRAEAAHNRLSPLFKQFVSLSQVIYMGKCYEQWKILWTVIMAFWRHNSYMIGMNNDREWSMIITEAMIIDREWSMIITEAMIIDHTWSVFIDAAMNVDRPWSLIILIHAWMCCSC